MPRRRFPALLVAVFGAALPTDARGADAPPAPAPASPSPEPPVAAPAPDPADASGRDEALRRAAEVNLRVVELWRAGQFRQAEALARESLAIRERILGSEDPVVAESLMNLGAQLEGQAKYADARRLYERSLAIRERALGPDHRDVASSLNNLAGVLRALGDYERAKPLFERALAIVEKVLGRDHPDVALSLGNLAGLLKVQGDFATARPLYERAIEILERAWGKDHREVAGMVNNLATLLQKQGKLAEAQALFERSLAIQERTWGPDHPNVASNVHNLATNLHQQGSYAAAKPLYERALALRERALGRVHPVVARTVADLGLLLRDEGLVAEARSLFERALAIDEQVLGRDHPEVARILTFLAQACRAEGDLTGARALHERALGIRERTLGADHFDVGGSLSELADLLHDQGAYSEAKPLYERALSIIERAHGPDGPAVATALNNLAALLHHQADFPAARPLLERALAIHEKALGPGHLLVATDLNNLAEVLISMGEPGAARPLHERALAIRERVLGGDHPDIAAALENLGGIFLTERRLAEARPLFERALAIAERAHPKDHPAVGRSLGNLAIVLHSLGDDTGAQRLLLRSLTIDEAAVRAGLSALSASQRLAQVRSMRLLRDRWIDFTRSVGASGHAEVLRLRGIVARAEAAERALARRATGEQSAMLASLQVAARLAARLANQPPNTAAERAGWQERYARAAAERERLTRELTLQMAGARAALERLDLTEADVRAALPADTALIDVLRTGDRYVAWVLHAEGDVARVELGSGDAIDAACEAFVTAVTDDVGDEAARTAVARTGADLRTLVWAPLEARLGPRIGRVVLCPDAALASVPFAALPGAAPGVFLGDELVLSHVFHPFDLVPPKQRRASGTGALIVGGVDYDHAEADTGAAPSTVVASLDRAPRGGTFVPIPATKAEAEALSERFGKEASTLLLGGQATEARVREAVKGRRVVHVATHGFARTDLLAGLYTRKVASPFLSADAERQLAVGHDPMLLSGLALAGANPREGGGGDDGVLTALEASYLDLDGVELVTLSACETAKGTAESGEGVLGLVSAFRMAGARDVLASLWKVDDEGTRRLMDGVYARVLRRDAPLAPGEALRESARALRETRDPTTGKRRFAAPRYWAAFVAYGG